MLPLLLWFLVREGANKSMVSIAYFSQMLVKLKPIAEQYRYVGNVIKLKY